MMMPTAFTLSLHHNLPGILPALYFLASLLMLSHLSAGAQAGERKSAPGSLSQARGHPREMRTLILLDVNIRSSIRTVSEKFLSIQLDPAVVHNGWIDFLSSKRLVTLARGLSPAFLWFGGKRTDFLQFQNHRNLAKHRGELGPDYYLKNYEDDIVRSDIALDKQKGCKIAQHPDIMLELQREKASQMQVVLTKEQFSNTYSNITITEPNSYRTMVGRTINGSQLGKDYIHLKNLLQSIRFYTKASLYGPNIGRPRRNAAALLDGFMKTAGTVVNAVTWQHYYIDDQMANVADFMKTRLLDTLSDQIAKVHRVVNSHAPGKKVWLGGVGPSWAGGTTNLSDTFAAGFLWLNTLGMSAKQGIDVVIRNSFFDHGYTHLVDQNFNPLPDYWLSLLYKRLVGTKVLTVQVAGLQRKPRPGRVIRDKLRIYAHCTHIRNHNYLRGSITIYIINLHRSRKKIKLAGTLRDKTVHQYLFQPYGVQGLQAKSVQLNGRPLVMVDDETFPELKPRTLRAGRIVVVPPLSIGFYVVKNANAPSCKFR
ncbi:inactive heparanase-2 isoform X3 [Heterodontus francisci]|uniref:inactive heparanase-2 isoform X3 n=1 Tax=Heterodontus francisci TaxID=7792 RepID=UPI00355BF50E